MDEIFRFTIQGDNEGYVTFECPFCGSAFKLQAGEYQDSERPFDDLFCPYCGLTKNKNSFLSSDIIEKAQALAQNYIIEKLNKAFGKMQRSINQNNSVIKMRYKPLKKINVKELKDKDTSECIFECDCCQRHFKVLYYAGVSKIFCSYCGVDI